MRNCGDKRWKKEEELKAMRENEEELRRQAELQAMKEKEEE